MSVVSETDYFTELAQRIIKAASFQGPMGRLYQVDMRLRPTGKSGSLVIPLAGAKIRVTARTGAAIARPRPLVLLVPMLSAMAGRLPSQITVLRRVPAPDDIPSRR